jgi:hypothetical protein
MVVHFKNTSIVSGKPINKEKLAELKRRRLEQQAEDAKNPDKPKFILRRVS